MHGYNNEDYGRLDYVQSTSSTVNINLTLCDSRPGSVVGIATDYGLDDQGIESRWRRDFPHLSRPALRPPSLLYNGYRVFPGGKVRSWCDADPSPPSSSDVKNRVELYLYSP